MPTRIVTTDFTFAVFTHEADIDYLLARWIHFAGGGFHARAGFFAQQSCELYMKAVMVQGDKRYAETHKLLELARYCAQYDAFFDEDATKRMLTHFDSFDQVGRYGGAAKFDPQAQRSGSLEVVGVAIWTDVDLDNLDRFVFKARSLLDFDKIGFGDSLKSIQQRNRKNPLTSMWSGRPPLRVVLTRSNRFFRP